MSDLGVGTNQWFKFVQSVKDAVKTAGFPHESEGLFAAGIGELVNNIAEHSERGCTGYVVLSAVENGVFEFVVADKGIGVLESLRTNPNYSAVSDSGMALEEILKPGVSRHINEADRGNGFKNVVNGLANLGNTMRFRSGDHARVYARSDLANLKVHTAQKSRVEGFLITVNCSLSDKGQI